MKIDYTTIQPIIDNSSVGIVIFRTNEKENIYLNSNKRLLNILGLEDDSNFKNYSLFNYVHPDDLSILQDRINKAKIGLSNEVFSVRFLKEKNKYIFLSISLSDVICDEDGSSLLIAFISDITKETNLEKDAEKSRAIFKALVNMTKLTVFEVNVKKRTLDIILSDPLSSKFFDNHYDDVPESILYLYDEKDSQRIINLYNDMYEGKIETAKEDFWTKKAATNTSLCNRVYYSVVFDTDHRPIKIYGAVEDITNDKTEQTKFRDSLFALLRANNDTVATAQLNFTNNSLIVTRGSSALDNKKGSAKTITELFEKIISLVTNPIDKEKCKQFFDYQDILKNPEKERPNHIDYRRKNADNQKAFWARSFITILENPKNDDVEGILYTVDISKEKRQEQILKILTDQVYDCVSLIHTDTKTIEFLHISSLLLPSYHILFDKPGYLFNYDEVQNYNVARWIDESNSDYYLKKTTIDTIMMELDLYGSYNITILGRQRNGESGTMYCNFLYLYLDEGRSTILLIQSDVTETNNAQQSQNRLEAKEKEITYKGLDSVGFGVAVVIMYPEKEPCFDFINTKLRNYLGYTYSNKELPRDIASFVFKDDLERVLNQLADGYQEKLFYLDEFRLKKNDGTVGWVKGSVAQFKSDENECVYFLNMVDMTNEIERFNIESRDNQESKIILKINQAILTAENEYLSLVQYNVTNSLHNISETSRIAKNNNNSDSISNYLNTISSNARDIEDNIQDSCGIFKSSVSLNDSLLELATYSNCMKSLILALSPVLKKRNDSLVFEEENDISFYTNKIQMSRLIFGMTAIIVDLSNPNSRINFSLKNKKIDDNNSELSFTITSLGLFIDRSTEEQFLNIINNGPRTPIVSKIDIANPWKYLKALQGKFEIKTDTEVGTSFIISFMNLDKERML